MYCTLRHPAPRAGLLVCLIIALPFFSKPTVVSAQYLSTVFGESAILSQDIAVDDNGNAYITGSFIGTAGFEALSGNIPIESVGLKDIFVAKYDPAGSLQWGFGIGGIAGGPGVDDEGVAIEVTETGLVYVTGFFQGTADFDPGTGTFELTSTGFRDAFIACYSVDGTFQWAHAFGGTGDDRGLGLAASNIQVAVTGHFRETASLQPGGTEAINMTSAGQEDGFVLRFSPDGEPQWGLGYGSFSVDSGKDLAIDNNGNIYLLGEFSDQADFDPGAEEAVRTSLNRSLDVIVASYSSEGAFRWAVPFGSGQADGANGIAVDNQGHAYVTGHFVGQVDFDPGEGEARLTSTGAQDIFLAKYVEEGAFDWAIKMGSGLADGLDLEVNPSGHLGFVGVFSGEIFPSPASTLSLTTQGEQDVIVASYDPDGSLRWAGAIGGPMTEFGMGLAFGANNNMYVTGHFENTVDFDPGEEVVERSSNGELDGFIVQYNMEGVLTVGLEAYDSIQPLDYELAVYPNPAHSSITVMLPNDPGVSWEIEVLDTLGRSVVMIDDVGFYGIQMHINTASLASGTYYVRADNGDALLLESFVVAR